MEITGTVLRATLGDRLNKPGHALHYCPVGCLDQIGTFSGYQYYADTFVTYAGPSTGETATGGWLAGETGTSVIGLENVTAAPYGVLQIKCAATADNDAVTLQRTGNAWGYVVGKRLWCFSRLNLDVVATGEAIFGLLPTTAAASMDLISEVLALDEGIYFDKTDTGTKFNFSVRKTDVSTTATEVTGTIVGGTFTILGFAIDSAGNVTAYQGSTLDDLAVIATVAAGSATLPTSKSLALTFARATTEAVAKDITVDWVFVAQEV